MDNRAPKIQPKTVTTELARLLNKLASFVSSHTSLSQNLSHLISEDKTDFETINAINYLIDSYIGINDAQRSNCLNIQSDFETMYKILQQEYDKLEKELQKAEKNERECIRNDIVLRLKMEELFEEVESLKAANSNLTYPKKQSIKIPPDQTPKLHGSFSERVQIKLKVQQNTLYQNKIRNSKKNSQNGNFKGFDIHRKQANSAQLSQKRSCKSSSHFSKKVIKPPLKETSKYSSIKSQRSSTFKGTRQLNPKLTRENVLKSIHKQTHGQKIKSKSAYRNNIRQVHKNVEIFLNKKIL